MYILKFFGSENPQQHHTQSNHHQIPMSVAFDQSITRERRISHSELTQGQCLQTDVFTGSFTQVLVATCYKQDLEKYVENIISLVYLNTEFKNLKISEY